MADQEDLIKGVTRAQLGRDRVQQLDGSKANQSMASKLPGATMSLFKANEDGGYDPNNPSHFRNPIPGRSQPGLTFPGFQVLSNKHMVGASVESSNDDANAAASLENAINNDQVCVMGPCSVVYTLSIPDNHLTEGAKTFKNYRSARSQDMLVKSFAFMMMDEFMRAVMVTAAAGVGKARQGLAVRAMLPGWDGQPIAPEYAVVRYIRRVKTHTGATGTLVQWVVNASLCYIKGTQGAEEQAVNPSRGIAKQEQQRVRAIRRAADVEDEPENDAKENDDEGHMVHFVPPGGRAMRVNLSRVFESPLGAFYRALGALGYTGVCTTRTAQANAKVWRGDTFHVVPVPILRAQHDVAMTTWLAAIANRNINGMRWRPDEGPLDFVTTDEGARHAAVAASNIRHLTHTALNWFKGQVCGSVENALPGKGFTSGACTSVVSYMTISNQNAPGFPIMPPSLVKRSVRTIMIPESYRNGLPHPLCDDYLVGEYMPTRAEFWPRPKHPESWEQISCVAVPVIKDLPCTQLTRRRVPGEVNLAPVKPEDIWSGRGMNDLAYMHAFGIIKVPKGTEATARTPSGGSVQEIMQDERYYVEMSNCYVVATHNTDVLVRAGLTVRDLIERDVLSCFKNTVSILQGRDPCSLEAIRHMGRAASGPLSMTNYMTDGSMNLRSRVLASISSTPPGSLMPKTAVRTASDFQSIVGSDKPIPFVPGTAVGYLGIPTDASNRTQFVRKLAFHSRCFGVTDIMVPTIVALLTGGLPLTVRAHMLYTGPPGQGKSFLSQTMNKIVAEKPHIMGAATDAGSRDLVLGPDSCVCATIDDATTDFLLNRNKQAQRTGQPNAFRSAMTATYTTSVSKQLRDDSIYQLKRMFLSSWTLLASSNATLAQMVASMAKKNSNIDSTSLDAWQDRVITIQSAVPQHMGARKDSYANEEAALVARVGPVVDWTDKDSKYDMEEETERKWRDANQFVSAILLALFCDLGLIPETKAARTTPSLLQEEMQIKGRRAERVRLYAMTLSRQSAAHAFFGDVHAPLRDIPASVVHDMIAPPQELLSLVPMTSGDYASAAVVGQHNLGRDERGAPAVVLEILRIVVGIMFASSGMDVEGNLVPGIDKLKGDELMSKSGATGLSNMGVLQRLCPVFVHDNREAYPGLMSNTFTVHDHVGVVYGPPGVLRSCVQLFGAEYIHYDSARIVVPYLPNLNAANAAPMCHYEVFNPAWIEHRELPVWVSKQMHDNMGVAYPHPDERAFSCYGIDGNTYSGVATDNEGRLLLTPQRIMETKQGVVRSQGGGYIPVDLRDPVAPAQIVRPQDEKEDEDEDDLEPQNPAGRRVLSSQQSARMNRAKRNKKQSAKQANKKRAQAAAATRRRKELERAEALQEAMAASNREQIRLLRVEEKDMVDEAEREKNELRQENSAFDAWAATQNYKDAIKLKVKPTVTSANYTGVMHRRPGDFTLDLRRQDIQIRVGCAADRIASRVGVSHTDVATYTRNLFLGLGQSLEYVKTRSHRNLVDKDNPNSLQLLREKDVTFSYQARQAFVGNFITGLVKSIRLHIKHETVGPIAESKEIGKTINTSRMASARAGLHLRQFIESFTAGRVMGFAAVHILPTLKSMELPMIGLVFPVESLLGSGQDSARGVAKVLRSVRSHAACSMVVPDPVNPLSLNMVFPFDKDGRHHVETDQDRLVQRVTSTLFSQTNADVESALTYALMRVSSPIHDQDGGSGALADFGRLRGYQTMKEQNEAITAAYSWWNPGFAMGPVRVTDLEESSYGLLCHADGDRIPVTATKPIRTNEVAAWLARFRESAGDVWDVDEADGDYEWDVKMVAESSSSSSSSSSGSSSSSSSSSSAPVVSTGFLDLEDDDFDDDDDIPRLERSGGPGTFHRHWLTGGLLYDFASDAHVAMFPNMPDLITITAPLAKRMRNFSFCNTTDPRQKVAWQSFMHQRAINWLVEACYRASGGSKPSKWLVGAMGKVLGGRGFSTTAYVRISRSNSDKRCTELRAWLLYACYARLLLIMRMRAIQSVVQYVTNPQSLLATVPVVDACLSDAWYIFHTYERVKHPFSNLWVKMCHTDPRMTLQIPRNIGLWMEMALPTKGNPDHKILFEFGKRRVSNPGVTAMSAEERRVLYRHVMYWAACEKQAVEHVEAEMPIISHMVGADLSTTTLVVEESARVDRAVDFVNWRPEEKQKLAEFVRKIWPHRVPVPEPLRILCKLRQRHAEPSTLCKFLMQSRSTQLWMSIKGVTRSQLQNAVQQALAPAGTVPFVGQGIRAARVPMTHGEQDEKGNILPMQTGPDMLLNTVELDALDESDVSGGPVYVRAMQQHFYAKWIKACDDAKVREASREFEAKKKFEQHRRRLEAEKQKALADRHAREAARLRRNARDMEEKASAEPLDGIVDDIGPDAAESSGDEFVEPPEQESDVPEEKEDDQEIFGDDESSGDEEPANGRRQRHHFEDAAEEAEAMRQRSPPSRQRVDQGLDEEDYDLMNDLLDEQGSP